jgi:ribosomal protein S18 acetylase RimI-like enzyme
MNQQQKAVEILSSAFDKNLSVNYVTKQDRKRAYRLKYLMHYAYLVCERWGKIYSANDNAFALLLLPRTKRTHLKDILLDINLLLRTIGLKKIIQVLKRESFIKQHHPKVPFYYLWFVGVAPEAQGKGIGTSLLKGIISDSEKEGMDIYLETSMKQNLPLYHRLGFETYEHYDFGFTLFLMKRKVKK